jgi:betaine reductase
VPERVVVRAVRYFLAHTPGLVRHGSKPAREIPRQPDLWPRMRAHLRPYEAALAYPPNRVFLGRLRPGDLEGIPRPWWQADPPPEPERWMPFGELMPEEEFYGLLKAMDRFDLVWLDEEFLVEARGRLRGHPGVTADDIGRLEQGHPAAAIAAQVRAGAAVPLELRDGRVVGCCNRAHEEDASLSADVLLENLACLTTATMATRTLVRQAGIDPERVEYVVGSGEEAVGDRYQRGGGNLAKAVAERCGLLEATGSDVKAFCCGPNHALAIGASLVRSDVFREVIVLGGCSLAKLGMKAQGHLRNDMPILEDLLAAFAVHLGPDDGVSPVIRLDALGRHPVRSQSSQQAILERLVADPLARLGMRLCDVDRYATELHNPEVTEPAGSGNVPLTNYRMIAALATVRGEIAAADIPAFVREHGMPGFSPTQGHVASAVPFLGHALEGMRDGRLKNTLFLAKGSLFLGRMTQMSDGLSFLLERQTGSGAAKDGVAG